MPETDQTSHEPVEQAAADREALETKTAATLAEVFKDGDEELVDTPAKPSKEAVPATEAVEEKPAAVATEETTEKKPEAAAEDPVEKPTVPASPANALIPAAYRRSLKAYQWTDEEIDEAAKANPAGFLKIAEKTHMARVEQTKQWAEAGRHAQTSTPAPKTEPASIPKVDIKALREKYGNEPFIDALEAQQLYADKITNEVMPFIRESKDRQAKAELDSLSRQIDGYFGSKELEPYIDHYGKAGKTLTPEQEANRSKVLEQADLLISGARAMGRPITLDEALTMAHDSVSSPIKAKVAVAKVATAVRSRQNSISLRPNSRATTLPKDARKDLEGKVRSGLAAAFK